MKLLLHVCCAPDATTPYLRLEEGHEVTCFFYNPNIDDEQEYERRLQAMERLSEIWQIRLLPSPYEVERWKGCIEGLEGEPEGGKRCLVCYRLRMEETARKAREEGYEGFATTLTISPHKNADRINTIGRALEERHGVKYLASDFKKKGGFKESVEWSKRLGLYRQRFCGCSFSKGG